MIKGKGPASSKSDITSVHSKGSVSQAQNKILVKTKSHARSEKSLDEKSTYSKKKNELLGIFSKDKSKEKDRTSNYPNSVNSSVNKSKSSQAKNALDELKFGNYLKLNYFLENKNIKHVEQETKVVESKGEQKKVDDIFLVQQIKNLEKKPLKKSTIMFFNNNPLILKETGNKRKSKKKNFMFQAENLSAYKNKLLNENNVDDGVITAKEFYDVDNRKYLDN